MAGKTSTKSAKVAKKAAAKGVAAKAARMSGARWMAPEAGLYRDCVNAGREMWRRLEFQEIQ